MTFFVSAWTKIALKKKDNVRVKLLMLTILSSPCHGSRGPVLAAPGEVTPLPAVVLLLHQVIASPEGHQVGVVGRGGDGDRPGAPDVGVAELVGQLLELISVEMVIIPEDVIVTGTGGALDTCKGRSVKVLAVSSVYLGGSRDRSRTPWGG